MSSKPKKKSNNKTTTGTGKNTPMLGIPNNTEPSSNSDKKNGKATSNRVNVESLAELEAKTKELKEKLEKINHDIELEKNLFINDTSQLNTDLTEKSFIISDLSSENKDIVSKLKSIKSNLDNKVKIGEIFLKKNEDLKKQEKKLLKDIEIREKQIKMAIKNKSIYERDLNLIETLDETNDKDKEKLLNSELENLETFKNGIINENNELKKIIKEHKSCPKEKANLTSLLNVITNSYQFEIKKTSMKESDIQKLEEKKERIKKERQEKKDKEILDISNNINRSKTISKRIRKEVLTKMKKKKSEQNLLPSRASKYIEEICNTMEAQEKKNSGDIKNINNTDYQLKPKTLFTDNEQLQLASIIPTNYLNDFKEKFDSIENERYELIEKIKNNQEKHNNKLNSVKLQLNYTELKKKEQKLLFLDFQSNLIKKNADISKIKTQINKITREFNTWNKLLKMKINENTKLNKYIREMKKRNGDIEENEEVNKNNSKGKNIGKSEENSKHNIKGQKRLYKLKKQNNINFEYDMDK
jgi:hypothetical protein